MVAKQHYMDAPDLPLSTLIAPDRFRTVMPVMYRGSGGADEIKVEMDLGEAFVVSLTDNPTLDGITVYGFVRENQALRSVFGEDLSADRYHCEITLSDWGNRFLLLCRGVHCQEFAGFVTPEEVRNLLENCLRAPIIR